MGNPRNWTTQFNAVTHELADALKANGITKNKRRKFISKAAAGRPANLAEQARQAVTARRIASVKAQEGRGAR